MGSVNSTNNKTVDKLNALTSACVDGRLDDVKKLLCDSKIDVNAQDGDGRTALNRAAYYGHIVIMKHLLRKCHADVNAADKSGDMAIHHACANNRLDIVKLLIDKYGVSVNVRGTVKFTPLINAVYSSTDSFELVTYLLHMKADVNFKSKDGDMAIHIASWRGNVNAVKRFIQQCGVSINVPGANQCTPLMRAAYGNKLDVVKLLTEMKADVNCQSEDGDTALLIAARKGNNSIMKHLLQCNAEVNAVDKDGTSPLHIAASARPGNMRMVKYLVEKCHAVILTTSNDGITPISAGTDQIASYLKQQLKERIMKSSQRDAESDTNVRAVN